jgi:glycosyltransferase involved in cell wall biosynthesis
MTSPSQPPRVAFFPDSFHEVNGVAHTSRHFEAFARRRALPFLCVRAGSRQPRLIEDGPVWTLELDRGFFSFPLEKDLYFDPLYCRHLGLVGRVLDRFRPDLIHVTGPSDLGILGMIEAHRRHLPLAASWHTNVHEYLARRSEWLFRPFSAQTAARGAGWIEEKTMAIAARIYAQARVLYAPNPQLCQELARRTGRPCHRMPRGVDAELFSPAKRRRAPEDDAFVLGFVGRLSVEKNIALLVEIEKTLVQNEKEKKKKFRIVGHGGDEPWLRANLPGAEFTGVLRGEALSAAYAGMDLFVFPSHTDTFGNVVLEALSSGVPAIVTPDGGPASIVQDGVTGRIVPDAGFAPAIAELMENREKHQRMRQAARAHALTQSWDSVFDGVYSGYQPILARPVL